MEAVGSFLIAILLAICTAHDPTPSAVAAVYLCNSSLNIEVRLHVPLHVGAF